MYQVTQPGLYHTAGADGLPGIDFGGKTGTAQVVGHDTKVAKTHATLPNVWFVGVTPTRNPELVVAVLWQNGSFSYYPARIGARVVAAYVEKQRRLAHNLMPVKAPAPPPVEVGAVWTTPGTTRDANGQPLEKIHAGHFYVGPTGVVAANTASSQRVKDSNRSQTKAEKPQVAATQPVPALNAVQRKGQ